jgi:cardiolipin synthase
MKNSYELISETKVIFKNTFSELKNAKKSIFIECYQLKDDHISRELIRILARKSLEIPVILIVDGLGFEIKSKAIKNIIEKSNIEFYVYNPIRWLLSQKHISRFSRFVMRNHRKLIIIDEEVAYTGGTNFTAQELKWRDILFKIKGPIVNLLLKSFQESKAITIHNSILNQPINKKLTTQFKNKDTIIRQIPHSFHRPMNKELKKLFSLAKNEIRITTPYFIPTVQLLYMMYKAIRKGVVIKVLIPHKSDNYWIDIISDFFAYVVYKNKVEVYLQKKMSHAKYIVFDKKVATFGSHNFDHLSFYQLCELNIVTKNKEAIIPLKELFDSDIKKSIRFSEKTRRNNNLWRKTVAKMMHPFKKYF